MTLEESVMTLAKKKRSYSGKVQAYIGKTLHKKADVRWRKAGYFSESDYVRDLIRVDLLKKK